MDKPFDIVVFGATGFTGRLVAEYLNTHYGVGRAVAWAIAGRNRDKLAEVREEIGAPSSLPLLEADAAAPQSLAALAQQARVVISTVGPYQRYGEPLVRACADAGTDYVDLCGEPAWMARMIAQYDAAAKASGARIVFSCGFDSIPFDLGVLFLQDEAVVRPTPRPRARSRARSPGHLFRWNDGQRAGHHRGRRARPRGGADDARSLRADARVPRAEAAGRRGGEL
jgi:short subunit dehydrogenase-like uncharacterized protein